MKKEQLNTAWVARLHVPRSSLLDDSNSLSSVMPRTPQQQLVRQGAAARQSPEDRETLPPSGESGGATSTPLLFYTQLLVPAREEVLAMDDRWSEAIEPLGGGTPSSGDVLLLCEECCAQLHRAYASGLEFPKSLVSCVCSLAESGGPRAVYCIISRSRSQIANLSRLCDLLFPVGMRTQNLGRAVRQGPKRRGSLTKRPQTSTSETHTELTMPGTHGTGTRRRTDTRTATEKAGQTATGRGRRGDVGTTQRTCAHLLGAQRKLRLSQRRLAPPKLLALLPRLV